MVRYNNASVTILVQGTETNDEGDIISTYTDGETIIGDVQPHALTEEDANLYGLGERRAGVKLFLYNGKHASIAEGSRARVSSDLSGDEKIYQVMPVNAWSRHGECLLVPVENE